MHIYYIVEFEDTVTKDEAVRTLRDCGEITYFEYASGVALATVKTNDAAKLERRLEITPSVTRYNRK